jgi:SAM-dependent methyltransferase
LARLDPLWAILTTPDCKGNRWDLTRFFHTGAERVEAVMQTAAGLGHPRERQRLLDFGCGVGRLTRAFARHFAECVGVDIAETMIARAREFNADTPACAFVLNDSPDLRRFDDGSFDMVYTEIVLQHLPDRETIRRYLREFVRVVRPQGLIAFQLPCWISWAYRFRLRRRLYLLLRGLGLSDSFLHHRLNLTTILMQFLPVGETTRLLTEGGARLLEVRRERVGPVESATYFATKDR